MDKEISKEKINSSSSEIQKGLANGIYLLEDQFKDTISYTGEDQIIPYVHDFLDSTSEEEIYFFVIDTTEFIPLDLKEKPEGVAQKDQRIHLMLSLSDVAAQQMASFTEKHIGKHIALVIGGKAYTKHKIREKITGGKLQISRCTDNACEQLLVELKNNYPN